MRYQLSWLIQGQRHPCKITIAVLLNLRTYIYPTPPLRQDMTQGQFFKQGLTGLNSEFSFSKTSCLTKAEEPSLPYYLPMGGERIIGFIPFPKVLVLCEMQSVSSRIWTRVVVSISYDDNHYTTSTSITTAPPFLNLRTSYLSHQY